MAQQTITLADIRTAAERLANAHREMTIRAKAQEEEIAALVAPIAKRHRPGLEVAAEERARAHEDLMALVESAPNLFIGRKRSLSVDGVRTGYRKQEDTFDWDDDEQVCRRIHNLFPDQEEVLMRTTYSPVVDAIAQLEPVAQRQIGVRRIPGVDQAFITIGDSDVDKLVKTILASIASRTGEDDGQKPKKGKAKVKSGAAV